MITLPSRTRPQLIASLGERIAEIGRLPWLGSLAYAGPGPGGSGQFNSPQRLQAVWRELQVPGPLADAVASLGGPVLVIDDRIDSGWTMTVAARLIRQAGHPVCCPSCWPPARADHCQLTVTPAQARPGAVVSVSLS